MDINLSDADLAFRDAVRSFLHTALTDDIREGARLTPGVRTRTEIAQRWTKKLAKYTSAAYPPHPGAARARTLLSKLRLRLSLSPMWSLR